MADFVKLAHISNKSTKPDRLYIAYGSNLHIKGMQSRCPDAKPIGPLMMGNARLVFRGVADVQVEPDSMCPAGLWEISERDEERLDIYEGVRNGLYQKHWVKLPSRRRKALIYLMPDRGIFPPSAWYANVLRDGYRQFKLDESFLDEAIRHSFDQKAPSEQTRSRRLRQRMTTYQRQLVKLPLSIALEQQDQERAS